MTLDYETFVARKLTRVPSTGLASVPELHSRLFGFQRDVCIWALKRGRCAAFLDTGLGKTGIELVWADAVAQYTRRPVLVLAPLAVGAQTLREAATLGWDAGLQEEAWTQGGPCVRQVKYDDDGPRMNATIEITNYDRLHHFDPARFGGVVCDESSILKNSDSKTLARMLEMFAQTAFKLCASATPSPNDYTELGTHAEFLGVCSKQEMLAEYFVHDGGDTSKWRLKGHARKAFWRWVSTWAALLRKPSDLGYDDSLYDIPPLRMHHHTIAADPEETKAAGLLFAEPANTLTERRLARKNSLVERVAACAALVASEPDENYLVWCHLNAEGDMLEELIPFGIQVQGKDSNEWKEAVIEWFQGKLCLCHRPEFSRKLKTWKPGDGNTGSCLCGHAAGRRVLISKEIMFGYGLNLQCCARMAFVGPNDSYEQGYQAIRRCWRFGQKRDVHVHIFASELEGNVVANFLRKQEDARKMAEELSAETRDALLEEIRGQIRWTNEYTARALPIPDWLTRREADCE